jgi:hypothetical protein
MGLREWWDRLRGGDKMERTEEAMQETGGEQPPPLEDYQELRDDRAVEERFPGTERPPRDE